MTFKAMESDLLKQGSEAAALFFFEKDKKLSETAARADKAADGALREALNSGEFTGEANQVLMLSGTKSPRRLFLVGLGPKEEFDAESVRCAAAALTLAAKKARRKSCAVELNDLAKNLDDKAAAAAAFAEGASLADYEFEGLKGGKNPNPAKAPGFVLCADKAVRAAAARAMAEAVAVTECVKEARDINFLPGSEATAEYLGDWAKRVARQEGLACRVLGKKEIEKEKMNGLLAVNKGSALDPRFIVLEYKPAGKAPKKTVALVGKGLTFDSGGISLKPGLNMHEMKYDKSGGCAVIAAMRAVARLKPPHRVIGLVAATENMPGGRAQRPGDVIRYANGKTVEVLNTDAEGRLVLADALLYSGRCKPDFVIDLATLTGAVLIALGENCCGALGNDEGLTRAVVAAGERCGERAWPLPLWKKYSEQLKSDCADLANIGGRNAGTITGAAFLKHFVPDGVKWVHLDIAGVSWTDRPAPYQVKGPTGFGVRLLMEFLKSL